MNTSKEAAQAWEGRWSRPVAAAAFLAVGLFVASIFVGQGVGTSDGESELLRNVDAHRSVQLISSVLQAIGAALLVPPLYYLFRAANARSERMRGQLVGVVIAAPLFLAAATILNTILLLQVASDFVTGEVPRLMSEGIALGGDRADEIASDALTDRSLWSLAAGFELGGRLGFAVAMFYTALHAMRTGLLTRFWGSLGMALGVVSFIPAFSPFALLWFAYLGLLLAGWIPGGKPPAWSSGEAEPWPTPGEKAAEELAERSDEERG